MKLVIVMITCQFISGAVPVVIFWILSLNLKFKFVCTCKQKIFWQKTFGLGGDAYYAYCEALVPGLIYYTSKQVHKIKNESLVSLGVQTHILMLQYYLSLHTHLTMSYYVCHTSYYVLTFESCYVKNHYFTVWTKTVKKKLFFFTVCLNVNKETSLYYDHRNRWKMFLSTLQYVPFI